MKFIRVVDFVKLTNKICPSAKLILLIKLEKSGLVYFNTFWGFSNAL